MKKLFTLLLVAVLSVTTSCEVLKETFTLAKAPQVINSVIPSAVRIGVAKAPESKKYLEGLVVVLNVFALGESFDPKSLTDTIKLAKIKELNTPEAQAVVESVVALYTAYYNSAIAVSASNTVVPVQTLATKMRPVVQALSTAISNGLGE